MTGPGLPAGAVILPALCEKHSANIVWALKFKRSDPWMAGIIVAQMLLFQQWTKSQACESPEQMNAALKLIPCLGCNDVVAFHRVMQVMAKGLDHASKVSKMEITDPDLEGV